MLYLAILGQRGGKRPLVAAARNVHRSFIYAAALLDLDVAWVVPPETDSVCACVITPELLADRLDAMPEKPLAMYVTSPDYLGNTADIAGLSRVCRERGILLLADNAHGAYFRFLEPSAHPIDLGADMCCDSAHKTILGLTGAAYLHLSRELPDRFYSRAREALAAFGSTSPSYLIMRSLDLFNGPAGDEFREKLAPCVRDVSGIRQQLTDRGWQILKTDPLRITIKAPDGTTGTALAAKLRAGGVECEFADCDHLVLMATPCNTREELERIPRALGENNAIYTESRGFRLPPFIQKMSVREAVFAESRVVSVTDAAGCVCGAPVVSCPPAVPIAAAGELITEDAVRIMEKYGVETVQIVVP